MRSSKRQSTVAGMQDAAGHWPSLDDCFYDYRTICRAALDKLIEEITVLADLTPAAEAGLREVPDMCDGYYAKTLQKTAD